jgi:N-sulfoglucosamine sulfohydrolase
MHSGFNMVDRREAIKWMSSLPLLGVAGVSSALPEADPPPRPNILLIHCHDLGQFLHCYGVGTVQTPNLDRLAREGVRFAQSYCTAPQCSPSRASLFTGRFPHSNGVMGLCHADFAWDLRPEEKHLGQYLKESGYRTAAVGVVHETRSGAKRCGLDSHNPKARALEATDATLELLEEFSKSKDSPFYVQVGFIEPHRLATADRSRDLGFLGDHLEKDDELGVAVPGYLRDTPGTREELAELQGAVRHVDEQVGRILARVQELGLEEDTLVLFTTDHGIAMPRAKCSIYDPGIQVALMLRLPSREGWHGGRVVEETIQNLDIVPTLLDLVGISKPNHLHGISFAPLLEGGDYTPRQEIFAEITYHDYYDPRRCIRTDSYKLIVNFTTAPFYMDPSQSWRPRSDTVVPSNHAMAYHKHVELYDLKKDPWELEDVSERPEYAEVRKDLLARLQKHLTKIEDPILKGAVTSPMHEKTLEFLSRTDV